MDGRPLQNDLLSAGGHFEAAVFVIRGRRLPWSSRVGRQEKLRVVSGRHTMASLGVLIGASCLWRRALLKRINPSCPRTVCHRMTRDMIVLVSC